MNLHNNTILITGGSSGIGFELAERLTKENNKVLICGRSLKKLEEAKTGLPELDYFQCDLSNPQECIKLVKWVAENHPECNVLINNAAIVHTESFREDELAIEKAEAEVQTNLMAPIRLAKYFIPLLEQNKNPQIINITTGLVYAPKAAYPFYNATKAALHSFTQVLRIQLEASPIEVTEVMFPAVDTPWHNGHPPKIAIPAEKAVDEMIRGLQKQKPEIRVAKAKLIYLLSRMFPGFALRKINSLAS
jgi:uncharacterized oxidoreductase